MAHYIPKEIIWVDEFQISKGLSLGEGRSGTAATCIFFKVLQEAAAPESRLASQACHGNSICSELMGEIIIETLHYISTNYGWTETRDYPTLCLCHKVIMRKK